MSTVVIVIEGGRIQDIYADSSDTRLIVKDYDDLEDETPPAAAAHDWPVHVIGSQEIEPILSEPA